MLNVVISYLNIVDLNESNHAVTLSHTHSLSLSFSGTRNFIMIQKDKKIKVSLLMTNNGK